MIELGVARSEPWKNAVIFALAGLVALIGLLAMADHPGTHRRTRFKA